MFTGIIESLGRIIDITENSTNKTFTLSSEISKELSIDQSLSHDGVCLTVIECQADTYKVTAVHETLAVSNLGIRKVGDEVNLERCMQMNGRLDGHIVQGHVDTTAVCRERVNRDGSTEFVFTYKPTFAALLVEKGSVCVNGISLTCYEVSQHSFRVAVIPYTYEHTNLKYLQLDGIVNIEFDILGKFVQRNLTLR